jgi:hypothetical protein
MTTAQPKDRTAGFTPSPTEPLKHQLLATLAQHRMASTHQLHALLRPGRSRQSVSERLNQLLGKHPIDFVVLPQSHRTRVWYLTPKGARLTRDWPIQFVTDARHRGDEHGHLDWTPEVSHPIGDSEKIVADALLHYTLNNRQQRRKLRAFIEVDRATMSSERLATKLIEYARLWTYEPQPAGRRRQTNRSGWLRWYPVFPRILFVLTGAGRQ